MDINIFFLGFISSNLRLDVFYSTPITVQFVLCYVGVGFHLIIEQGTLINTWLRDRFNIAELHVALNLNIKIVLVTHQF